MDFKGVDGCEGYVGFGGSGDVECPSAVANCLGPFVIVAFAATCCCYCCNLQLATGSCLFEFVRWVGTSLMQVFVFPLIFNSAPCGCCQDPHCCSCHCWCYCWPGS